MSLTGMNSNLLFHAIWQIINAVSYRDRRQTIHESILNIILLTNSVAILITSLEKRCWLVRGAEYLAAYFLNEN